VKKYFRDNLIENRQKDKKLIKKNNKNNNNKKKKNKINKTKVKWTQMRLVIRKLKEKR